MIKPNFLKKQINKSRAQRTTAPFLRRLVFTTVDQVAREHYELAYPMKCLQTSAAAKALLENLGIKSRLWMGATCFAEAFEQGDVIWGGFWDRDHHVWLVTEFSELVDLSIAQMHQHPNRKRDDGIPVLPIWWDETDQWPDVIRYLPDGPVKIGLDDPVEIADLNIFLTKVRNRFEDLLRLRCVEDVKFGPILADVAMMDSLHKQNHPWLIRAAQFSDRGIPFPPWIQKRDAELTAAYEACTLALPKKL